MGSGIPAVRRIVVGVDGSQSKQALRWVIEQAWLTGAVVVDAVVAWICPTLYGWAMTKRDPQLDHAAEKALVGAVEEVAGQEPSVEIRRIAVSASAAQVLLEQARGADLLLVGSRGQGDSPEPCWAR